MTKKEHILDSLADGGNVGESDEQIWQYFKFVKIKIDEKELRKLINELMDEKMIYITKSMYLHSKPMYAMTEKGREVWSNIMSEGR